MDGTAYVTQCPISPQKSFLYNFTSDNQVGTFWYHSHYAVQYCDGLRGPFIIRDREDPFRDLYDFDDGLCLDYCIGLKVTLSTIDSTIITLMDWYAQIHLKSTLAPILVTQVSLPFSCHASASLAGFGPHQWDWML